MDGTHKSIFQSVETTTVLIDGSRWIINESSESSIGYFILLALEAKRRIDGLHLLTSISPLSMLRNEFKTFPAWKFSPHRETHLQHDRFMFQMTYL